MQCSCEKKYSAYRIDSTEIEAGKVCADDRSKEDRQVLHRIAVRSESAFDLGVSGSIHGFLIVLPDALTARIGIIKTTIRSTIDEGGAVRFWDEGEDVECGYGVD